MRYRERERRNYFYKIFTVPLISMIYRNSNILDIDIVKYIKK